jgi:dihydrodipicolinate synthase/N-acetylneuraminate lyase
MTGQPWHGVLVASALPFSANLHVDFDKLGEHVSWLAASGCEGLTPNGSLGEYETLSDWERAQAVEVARDAAPPGFNVIPEVSASGWREAVRWADQAASAGAPGVMALPPNIYRADESSIVDHFRAIASVGLPVIAHNDPFDTKADLTPDILARLYGEGLIVAVKDSSGDPRRAYAIKELATGLDILIGSDDTVLETAIAGACGWVSGCANAFPRTCVTLYQASIARDLATALPLYRQVHALLRWDDEIEFVQAIKLSMDVAGRYGGPCRPPRRALSESAQASVRKLTERAISLGAN